MPWAFPAKLKPTVVVEVAVAATLAVGAIRVAAITAGGTMEASTVAILLVTLI